MFEHFGLKDAFCAIWRYKSWILGLALLVAGIGTVAVTYIPIPQKPIELGAELVQDDTETVVYDDATVQFYLEYQGEDSSLTSSDLAKMYLGTFSSYSCNKYISEYVLDRMTREDIIEKLNLPYGPEKIKTDFFEQFVHASVNSEGGPDVVMFVRSIDREYSILVVDAYLHWVEQLVEKGNNQVQITILDESVEEVEIPPVTEQTVVESKGVSWKVMSILFFVIMVVLGSIVAMGIRLFNPTVNRKNDLEEMGLTVLGEIRL